MIDTPPSINTQSILSLVFGILTILSFCMGMIPIPFTGFVCFPASIVSGLIALIFGGVSLGQIRRRGQRGSAFAWIGLIIGGFALFALLCIAGIIIFVLVRHPSTFPNPFFNYQA